MTPTFEIKELSPLQVVTCPHLGDYSKICDAFQRLAAWAAPKGLMAGEPRMAAIYHDDPSKTAVEKLHSDACLVVTSDVAVDGEIKKHTIKGGKFAVGHFELSMNEFGHAWTKIYDYLKAQGYHCGDGDHYELYLNNPENHPKEKWLVDICVPIK